MWKHLTHPNVLPLLGVTIAPLQLISDLMPGGDLPRYIKNNPDADLLCLVGVPPVARSSHDYPPTPVIRRRGWPLLPPLL